MKKLTFYPEDDNNEKFIFDGEKLTFTLQMVKFEQLNELSKV